MTPRQEHAIDVGWEIMKIVRAPHIFLWLAEDGWEGGSELMARRESPGNVAVSLLPHERLILLSPTSLN